MMGLLFTIMHILLSFFTVSGLYLISIKPRIHGRPDYKPFFGHMYAHRGLHNMNPAVQKLKNIRYSIGQQPENTPSPAECRM